MKDQCFAVTGANGYIGSHLSVGLAESGATVKALVRSKSYLPKKLLLADMCAEVVETGDITKIHDWSGILRNVNCVVHCAGIAHKKNSTNEANLNRYLEVNCEATLAIARSAAKIGVERFIFISTAAVYGIAEKNIPLNELSVSKPTDAYGESKYHAEIGLQIIGENSKMEVIIIRPPMIYGPYCPGNLKKLFRIIQYGIPMPLGNLKGRRSVLGIGNLTNFILKLSGYPYDASGIWNVTDRESVEFETIISSLGKGCGKKPWLVPVPLRILRVLFYLIGQKNTLEKLDSPVVLDSIAVERQFGWIAPYDTNSGLEDAARSFHRE